jgi:hypothetical protein
VRKILVAAGGILGLAATALAGATSTVQITPSNTQGWVISATNNATATIVSGPGTPPAGTGSLELATNSATGGKPQAASPLTSAFVGVYLADLTTLKYSSYISDYADENASLNVTLNVFVDLSGAGLGPYRTLVFEPCYTANGCANAPIQPLNTWTEWDALAPGAIWWSTGQIGPNPPFGAYTTLANLVLNHFPNAIVTGIVVQAGQGSGGAPWNNFVGYADALKVAASANGANPFNPNAVDVIYDFDPDAPPPPPVPVTTGDCKKGGWQSLTTAEGRPFRNQGDCVSYVASGGKARGHG